MNGEPKDYVQPDVSDARVERLWGNVSERIASRPVPAWRWVALFAAVSTVGAGAWLLRAGSASPSALTAHAVPADTKLETTSAPLAVTLVDGSSIELGSRTRLEVRGSQPSRVALALSHGEVLCDVPHREGRKFTVLAADVEVRVVGTQFRVSAGSGENPRVEVSVLRGAVEVVSQRRPGIVARVAAGQSWLLPAEPRLAPPSSIAPSSLPAPASSLAPVSARSTAPDSVDSPSKSDPPSAAAATLTPSARELFEKAGASRRAGDAAAAARGYEELLRLHPGDGRASLSAFELGRLRMDRLNDPNGAIAALERAVALNLGPGFREDALARLVSVYASQGKFAACARARDRYLSSYPTGVHSGAVASRCGSR